MSLDTTPRAYAIVSGRSADFTTPDGRTEPLSASAGDDIRQVILRRASAEARDAGIAVELVTTGERGEHHLLVEPDGSVESIAPPRRLAGEQEDSVTSSPSQQREEVNTEAPGREVAREDLAPEHSPRPTFVSSTQPPEREPNPWRALLARLGFGSSPVKSARHVAERTVAQQWAGCRTLAIANGKGGVGKTMTTAMLAAVFARLGGGSVLAWDNNDTRGTLGWRTEQGRYDATLKDLLPAAADLLTVTAGVSEIARYVHRQPVDRYDVLRSNPELLATHQRIDAADFDRLMQVVARYYRMVIFDSGNDESADRWLRMIDSSHQLVVPTLATVESAESAALLLEALRERDDRSRRLAQNAVVVVTEAEPNRRAATRIIDGFVGHVRAVEWIPFDPALKSGPLRFDGLHRQTRDAWVRAAAAAADGF